ncbi:methyltransferase family protein [Halohasta litchfieldiae]|jgi:ubiquinone/menaquinone biosynthesis C-methylase UbiE|uniref:Methyltransferase domain-containing protein n=1 Tax=Halohasta litchfieldiae TaxID=1073996 RepID=A0A1H6YHH0_9EURY|nr:class I SAM-dependent methyltransferase [Halohasta litchfieldiae]ATW86841.1 methyltransferase family protein [Halohasta litchfieldiae]SEJ36692.1 Methyltransferase domain-containing protein [Halohasta litchfieldiae]
MTADREGRADEPVGDEESVDQPAAEDLQAVYDRIATHFSQTREYSWPEVEEFVDSEVDRCGSLGRALDLGCGNGRHAETLANAGGDVVGLDVSRGLLAEARERAAEGGFGVGLVHGDASRPPFVDDRFSQIVYVATLHHLRTREARQQSLSEVGRVLAPGGRALVSAWSTAHDRFDATEGFDTTVDWTLPGGKQVGRYYHIYDPKEFQADLEAASVEIVDVRVSSGNCYAVVESSSDVS